MQIGGHTKVFALLGDPVAHSISPALQNAAFRALGIDAVYVPLRCAADEVPALMEALARQGGGGNVTVPHKQVAAAALARNGGAPGHQPICNTFWNRDGRLTGGETDSLAILAALESLGAVQGDWLVLGTGGSARAAVLAARRAGVRVAVRSRSAERAAALQAFADAQGVSAAPERACRVALNCTPVGLQADDPLPLEPGSLPELAVALDLVYRPGETSWVRSMRAAGKAAADGRIALLEQGAAAFELWFPGKRAPREVMRAAVKSALG